MTEDEITAAVSERPGVVVLVASAAGGAPEMAWGDSFFSYAPDGSIDGTMPFATIVTGDYPGFDESSNLARPGVFRLNANVGRERFAQLLGYPPAAYAERAAEVDHAVLDRVMPHPLYAAQGWVSILNPGPATDAEARALILLAHERAVARYRTTAD